MAKHSQWLNVIWITSQNGWMKSRMLTKSGPLMEIWEPHQTSHPQLQGARTGQRPTAFTQYFWNKRNRQELLPQHREEICLGIDWTRQNSFKQLHHPALLHTSATEKILHSLLYLPVGTNKWLPLHGERLEGVQDTFSNDSVLFIEKSMVAQTIFTMISKRLQEAHPHYKDKPFRNISVVLLGASNSCHQSAILRYPSQVPLIPADKPIPAFWHARQSHRTYATARSRPSRRQCPIDALGWRCVSGRRLEALEG